MTRDPLSRRLRMAFELHDYVYVGNNPSNDIDPYGLLFSGAVACAALAVTCAAMWAAEPLACHYYCEKYSPCPPIRGPLMCLNETDLPDECVERYGTCVDDCLGEVNDQGRGDMEFYKDMMICGAAAEACAVLIITLP